MNAYEVALLLLAVVLFLLLIWENHRLRTRLERNERDIDWCKVAIKNTVDVHQKVMDRHQRDIEKLEEQTGKIAAAGERFRQSQPNFGRLRADVDRLLKADMHRQSPGGGGSYNRMVP